VGKYKFYGRIERVKFSFGFNVWADTYTFKATGQESGRIYCEIVDEFIDVEINLIFISINFGINKKTEVPHED
jgi:hypothetical protein